MEIVVTLPHQRYSILVEDQAIRTGAERLQEKLSKRKLTLIADKAVFLLHGKKICSELSRRGFEVRTIEFSAVEQNKNIDTVTELYQRLGALRHERGEAIVSLGGGVAGDLVGFVAASYLRGVPFVQIPSTLLAMVDASIGGKVGYNLLPGQQFAGGKNLVGAFCQPELVIADVGLLRTLPQREYVSGLAECVKHGMLGNAALFAWMEAEAKVLSRAETAPLEQLVGRNVEIKARVVEEDERESDKRAALNLGHTFAHAIESATKYQQFTHGEAVALGLVAATKLSELSGKLAASSNVLTRVKSLLSALGLPISAKLPKPAELIELMQSDKKVSDGRVNFVLIENIGKCALKQSADPQLVGEAIAEISID